jgi:GTPase
MPHASIRHLTAQRSARFWGDDRGWSGPLKPDCRKQLRDDLKFLQHAPIVFISAKGGKGTEKIFPLPEQVVAERRKRIPTSAMNRFIETVDFECAFVPMRSRVKILYMTQASVAPPTFVFFTNRAVKLHFSYQRFLENQIREAFGFLGTPICIKNRARN